MDAVTTTQQMRDDFNRLRGRLFEAAEVLGLPQSQEDSFKSLIRRTTYEMQSSMERTLRKGS